MASIKIRVGAAVDASLATVFRDIADAARKARRVVTTEMDGAGKATGKAFRAGAKEATEAGAGMSKEAKAQASAVAKEAARAAKERVRAELAAVKEIEQDLARSSKYKLRLAREQAREERAIGIAKAREIAAAERVATREANQAARDRARAERQSVVAQRSAQRLALRNSRLREAGRARQNELNERAYGEIGGAALRTTRAALSFGTRVAGGFLAGEGVDLTYGTHAANAASLETTATRLTNAGYMPGKVGANGQRQDPTAVIADMQRIGDATATGYNVAIEGLDKFVSKTGDLQGGRDVMMSLARLSKASGADLSEMADAAGDVSNALGDVPNKAQAIDSVMRAIAAQGKEGAVEIKDLASQMAKLGAAAGQFSGDRTKAIESMGVLVQMTRAKGGAASSTQAATSVGSFLNTFSKGARLDAFTSAGIQVRNADGRLRSAEEIILESLSATKGDSRKMGKLFADSGARRVTRGFEMIYNDAGGGQAGLEAVRKAFEDLAASTMTEKEVSESFGRAMSTTESQAQLFNNQLQKTAGELQTALLPALQAATPAIVEMAATVSSFIQKIAGKDKTSEKFGADVGSMEKNRALLQQKAAAEGIPVDEYLAAHPEERAAIDKSVSGGKAAVSEAKAKAGKKGFFSDGLPALAAMAFDYTGGIALTAARGGEGIGQSVVHSSIQNDQDNARRLDQLNYSLDRLTTALNEDRNGKPKEVKIVSSTPRLYSSGEAGTTPVSSAALGH